MGTRTYSATVPSCSQKSSNAADGLAVPIWPCSTALPAAFVTAGIVAVADAKSVYRGATSVMVPTTSWPSCAVLHLRAVALEDNQVRYRQMRYWCPTCTTEASVGSRM